MANYGYNPKDYLQDFSWIGDIGQAISQTSLRMPELIELNKTIKENNKFKEMSWSAANQFINQMDGEDLSKIASTMGHMETVNSDDETYTNTRAKLKEMLPKFEDSSTNEDYAGKLTNAFFVPFLQAAQAKSSNVSFGKLFGNLQSGAIQNAIRGTDVGKEVIDKEKEQNAYTLGQERAKTEHATAWGEDGTKQQEFEKQNAMADARAAKLYQPVRNNIDYLVSQFTDYSQYPKMIAEAKKMKREFAESPEQSEMFEREFQVHVDNLFRKKQLEQTESIKDDDRAAKKAIALSERTAKEKEKADPTTKGESIAMVYDKSPEIKELNRVNSEIAKLETASTITEDQKKLLIELKGKREWLSTYGDERNIAMTGFQERTTGMVGGEPEEARVSTANKAMIDAKAQGETNRNLKTIRDSRKYVLSKNQFGFNDKKAADKAYKNLEKWGSEYMYDIVKGDNNRFYFKLKPKYEKFQDNLLTGAPVNVDSVTNRQQQIKNAAYKPSTTTAPTGAGKDIARIARGRVLLKDPQTPANVINEIHKYFDSVGETY